VAVPVRFPPGRAKLSTNPAATGSLPVRKTIGMLVVAALAARTARTWPEVAITETRRLTKSAAKAGNRSFCSVFDGDVLAFDIAGFT